MEQVTFIVDEAGCSSCAARVRAALEPLADVDDVQIDEEADAATVSLTAQSGIAEEDVQRALDAASAGAGHAYRVRASSWRPAGAPPTSAR